MPNTKKSMIIRYPLTVLVVLSSLVSMTWWLPKSLSADNTTQANSPRPDFIFPKNFGQIRPSLSILQNDANGLRVAFGLFPRLKSYENSTSAIATRALSYSLKSPGGDFAIKDAPITGGEGFISAKNFAETGAYELSVMCHIGKLDLDDNMQNPIAFRCWNQDIFIFSHRDRDLLNKLNIKTVANTYAPILDFAPTEQYFPASLSYILNKTDKHPQLDNQKVRVHSTSSDLCCNFETLIKFVDLAQFIKSHGNKNYMIDMGYEGNLSISGPSYIAARFGEGKRTPTDKAQVSIYYSVIPSHTNKNIIYLNYHTLYSYDSKGNDRPGVSGSTGIAGHAFDRESVTLKLKVKSSQEVEPVSIIYGSHLRGQMLGYLDAAEHQEIKWLGDGLEIPWREAKKLSEGSSHPVIAIAHGSHAIYPKAGTYGVYYGRLPILTEVAGGGDAVIPDQLMPKLDPESIYNRENTQSHKSYHLKLLTVTTDKDQEQSDSDELVFSGYWVTIFLGKPDATFPPFTHRETDPDAYVEAAAKPGITDDLPQFSTW